MPITTNDCKAALVAHCVLRQSEIRTYFYPNLTPEVVAKTFEPKNWKRESKSTTDGITLREFDCRPFDSQLRGYVYATETSIVSIEVYAE